MVKATMPKEHVKIACRLSLNKFAPIKPICQLVRINAKKTATTAQTARETNNNFFLPEVSHMFFSWQIGPVSSAEDSARRQSENKE